MAITPRQQTDTEGWARRWRVWLRTLGLSGGERTGSRVKRLEVQHGRVLAQVADRNGTLCDVEIGFAPWTDDDWQHAVDALGSQAIFAAQLLAGDLPPELDRTLAGAGVQLLPARLEELEHLCSCHMALPPGARRVCEHVTALYAALGELLPDDPWLLFRLRGRDQQGLLRNLRTQRARAVEAPGALSAFAGPEARKSDSGFYRAGAAVDEEIPTLESQMEKFWGSAKAHQEYRPHLVAPTVELALLRRLGPPPLGAASESTYEALTALYRRISHSALDVAFAVDLPDGLENDGLENGDGDETDS
jgi:uncharacterized Zn finger protein